jgi:hypothetical protein
MSAQKDKLRKVIKHLVAEQINTDRRFVTSLDKLDKAVKTLNKDYKALINNSFSRIVLDDGNSGNTFDVQIYPVMDISKDGTERYDLRAYLHDSDRTFKKNQSVDDLVDFIKKDLKDLVEEEESYVSKTLERGKRPSWDDSDYEYVSADELADHEKIHEQEEDSDARDDQMKEVKKFKKQSDYAPKDLKDVAMEEMLPGLNLEELAEKIEGAVWGAVKRDGESTHQKTAKATHEVKDSDTAKNAHVLTKSKRRKSKTTKIAEKSKPHEHSVNITSNDSKINTSNIKDYKQDKRKAEKTGKDEEYKETKAGKKKA